MNEQNKNKNNKTGRHDSGENKSVDPAISKDNVPIKNDTDNSSCMIKADAEQEKLRQGRKSLAVPTGKDAKNRIRYIEGTTPLKDGCWLSTD